MLQAKERPYDARQGTRSKRAALIQGLQEDLRANIRRSSNTVYSQARRRQIYGHRERAGNPCPWELDHALAIAKQLDYFGAYPTEVPKKVETPEDNEGMLWADLRAEDETVSQYRQRIMQAQELGEYALAEILQELTKQEQDHQIDLATALGVVADPRSRKETGPRS